MKSILSKAFVFDKDKFTVCDLLVDNGIIAAKAPNLPFSDDAIVYNLDRCFIFPGLIDVHVHLREPGFFYKESIASGTAAAAHGGYTTVCSMPNLDPVPDSLPHLELQRDIIRRDACIKVHPYGAITIAQRGERLADMEGMAAQVVAFSDDGHGVQSESLMKQAMRTAHSLDRLIVAHCEDNSLLHGGCIHKGAYAAAHGYPGICSESEYLQVRRDIELVAQTGCGYHICHISTAQSVQAVREAKARGLNVTCETAPHYLVLTEDDLQPHGRFKMNPPLRTAADRAALIEGIRDGTIDIIATDHAPHSEQEKSRGLQGSAFGIVGLETAFAILYTKLVKTGVITLERLIELMCINPARRFNIGASLSPGEPADLCVYNLERQYKIDSGSFLSKGRSTPFEGESVYGECLMTMCDGRIVWKNEEL